MRKILYFLLLLVFFASFKGSNENFVGRISYQNSFTDLAGNDITDRMTALVGKEQQYFINGKNYKTYDDKDNLTQLYNSESNTYYYISNKVAQKTDASTLSSSKYIVTKLDKKETIAGYNCKAIGVETDTHSIIYFFNPSLNIDARVYAKHNFGEWNKYLQATNGSLPLKYILTDNKNGYIWTSTVVKVEKMDLTDKDFSLPDDIQIKE